MASRSAGPELAQLPDFFYPTPPDFYGVRVYGQGGSWGIIRRVPGTDGPQIQVESHGLDPAASAGGSAGQKDAFARAVDLVRAGQKDAALAALRERAAFGVSVATFFTVGGSTR